MFWVYNIYCEWANLVAHLKHTCGPKNKHQNDKCINEIGVCTSIFMNSWFNSQHVLCGGKLYDQLWGKKERKSSL